jgi:hypothetical protein
MCIGVGILGTILIIAIIFFHPQTVKLIWQLEMIGSGRLTFVFRKNSVKSAIPAASKNSGLLVYSANTPMALSQMINGSTAIERTPASACILPKIETWVIPHIVGNDRGFLPDGPCGQPVFCKRALKAQETRFDGGHSLLIKTAPGHRNKPPLAGIDEGYPSHREFILLDRDPATAVEKIGTIPRACPQCSDAGDHCVQPLQTLKLIFGCQPNGAVASGANA